MVTICGNNFLRGCEMLTEAVMSKKPRYHIFGHVHKGHGNRDYYFEVTFRGNYIFPRKIKEYYFY